MQIKLAALGLVAAVGGGTWWATAPSGEYYAMAPTEVASRLVSAQMPGEMSDTMPGRGDLQHRVYKTGNGQVIWEFTAVDTPVATFTADLEPDGNGTRVSVEFALADNEFGEAAARDVGEAREILTGLLEIAMEEHISATLEMRPFSDDNFGREAAKYALTHPGAEDVFEGNMRNLTGPGRSNETEKLLREKLEADAAWHGDVEQDDTGGFDDPPADDW